MSGLYLASQSPRRTELLHQVGIDHTVVSSSYVEDNVVTTDPIEMVKAQALGKARCANDVPDGGIVLGADTIVVHNGNILGKPHSKDEARSMLRTLSGQVHSVITGVALLIKGREIVFHNERYISKCYRILKSSHISIPWNRWIRLVPMEFKGRVPCGLIKLKDLIQML